MIRILIIMISFNLLGQVTSDVKSYEGKPAKVYIKKLKVQGVSFDNILKSPEGLINRIGQPDNITIDTYDPDWNDTPNLKFKSLTWGDYDREIWYDLSISYDILNNNSGITNSEITTNKYYMSYNDMKFTIGTSVDVLKELFPISAYYFDKKHNKEKQESNEKLTFGGALYLEEQYYGLHFGIQIIKGKISKISIYNE
ncbi:MAG: hypothetical protein HRT66_06075 [Flavobacteriaceae bacterium]|nr:hypothetical protein [Flavobacteriaceae bacterium]